MIRVLATFVWLAAAASAQTVSATTEDGRKVQLFADGTWAYSGIQVVVPTTRLASEDGVYAVSFDAKKWTVTGGAVQNRRMLTHSTGSGWAVFASEGIPVALERLPDIALANARNADPAAEMISSEMTTVRGVEVLQVEIEATIQSIPFRYRSYYFGGEKGNAALVAYAHQSRFEALSADIDELLGGFEIHDTPLHAKPEDTQRTIELQEGGATFVIDTLQWKLTKSDAGRKEFQHMNGGLFGLAIGEPTQLPLDNLVAAALLNAQRTDAEAAIVLDEEVTVLEIPARRVTMQVRPLGVEYKFYSLLYSDESGVYQIICYATPDLFVANRQACEDFHAGLRPMAANR